MQNYNEQMGTLTAKVTSIAAQERFNANQKGYFVTTVTATTKSGEQKGIVANMPRKVFDNGVKVGDEVTVALSKDANGGIWANVIGFAGTALTTDILAEFDIAAPREQRSTMDILFGK